MRQQICPKGLLLISALLCQTGILHAQNQGNSGFNQQNQLNTAGQSQAQTQNQNQTQGQTQGPSSFAGPNAVQQQNNGQQQFGGQDGFIGNDAAQRRNQLQNQNGQQQRPAFFDFAIESLNDLRESRRQQNSNRNNNAPVRVKLRPLFTVVQPSPAELTTKVRSQLDRTMPISISAAPRVSVAGGTATLQGEVNNDYDRQLLAKMVSLQPGISDVDNRLTIEQPVQDQPLLVVPQQ